MCDLCEFQEELNEWIKEKITSEFTSEDAMMYVSRVSSVIKSLIDSHFDVFPKFDELSSKNTEIVRIIGNKSGESIEVDFFLFPSIFMFSSKKVSGMEMQSTSDKSCNCSICFDGECMDNWEFQASKFFEKILKAHRKGKRLNLKISAKSFHRTRGDIND